jgi:LPS-assembly lipoprotein
MPVSIRRLRPALFLAALALGGCTAGPLYAPAAVTGLPVRAELAAIEIPETGERVGQEVRNQLILAFTGGGAPLPPRYQLVLGVSSRPGGSVSPRTQTLALMQVSATWRLVDLGTGVVLLAGLAQASGAYALSNQGFADIRAQRDAEDRAAREVAGQIRLRVAAALAGAA